MANPQTEDGYTQISNEVLEAIATINLSPYESRVLWFVIRKTYGWHKKIDLIPLSQITDGTGIAKSHASRALKSLISKQIVTRLGNKQIGFQKDYDLWETQKLPVEATNQAEDINAATEVTSRGTPQKLPVEAQKLPVEDIKLPVEATKVTSRGTSKEKKETNQKKLIKRKYGEFNNVLLTDEEHQKLKDKFGARVPGLIEVLSTGIESKGYKYKNHYATILNWERRDKESNEKSGRPSKAIPGQEPTGAFADLARSNNAV